MRRVEGLRWRDYASTTSISVLKGLVCCGFMKSSSSHSMHATSPCLGYRGNILCFRLFNDWCSGVQSVVDCWVACWISFRPAMAEVVNILQSIQTTDRGP